jgi:hypothetical protein
MTVIKVAKTPRKAFNPDRPASRLLRAQIQHLEHATQAAPRKMKKLTEGEAAVYIGQLTARLLVGPKADIATPPAPPVRLAPRRPKRPVQRTRLPKRKRATRARRPR